MPITAEFVESTFQSSPPLTAALIKYLSAALPEPPLLKIGITEFLFALKEDITVSLPIAFIKRHLKNAYAIAEVAILCDDNWSTALTEDKCILLEPFLPILPIALSFIESECSFIESERSFCGAAIETWDDFLTLLQGISNVENTLYAEHGIKIYFPLNDSGRFLANLQEFAPPDRIREFAASRIRNDYYALIEAFSSGDAGWMNYAKAALSVLNGFAGYTSCFPRLMQRIAEMAEEDRHFMMNNWVAAIGLSEAMAGMNKLILSPEHKATLLATIKTIEITLEQSDDRQASPASPSHISFGMFADGSSASPSRKSAFAPYCRT